jgi:phage portal protein BeeE
LPAYNNIEALERGYYSQALQEPIESMELLLDEGCELPKPYGTEFDLDDLLRMDSATMAQTLSVRVGAGIDSPNEARKRLNQPPVDGGDTPYLQQQYWPLSQLAKRDIPAIPATPNDPTPPPDDEDDDVDDGEIEERATLLLTKELAA